MASDTSKSPIQPSTQTTPQSTAVKAKQPKTAKVSKASKIAAQTPVDMSPKDDPINDLEKKPRSNCITVSFTLPAFHSVTCSADISPDMLFDRRALYAPRLAVNNRVKILVPSILQDLAWLMALPAESIVQKLELGATDECRQISDDVNISERIIPDFLRNPAFAQYLSALCASVTEDPNAATTSKKVDSKKKKQTAAVTTKSVSRSSSSPINGGCANDDTVDDIQLSGAVAGLYVSVLLQLEVPGSVEVEVRGNGNSVALPFTWKYVISSASEVISSIPDACIKKNRVTALATLPCVTYRVTKKTADEVQLVPMSSSDACDVIVPLSPSVDVRDWLDCMYLCY